MKESTILTILALSLAAVAIFSQQEDKLVVACCGFAAMLVSFIVRAIEQRK